MLVNSVSSSVPFSVFLELFFHKVKKCYFLRFFVPVWFLLLYFQHPYSGNILCLIHSFLWSFLCLFFCYIFSSLYDNWNWFLWIVFFNNFFCVVTLISVTTIEIIKHEQNSFLHLHTSVPETLNKSRFYLYSTLSLCFVLYE